MLRTTVAVLLLTAPVAAFAQAFQQEGGAFIWRNGNEFVRFDNARFTAGVEGGPSVGWHAFLWHDSWIYESLSPGEVIVGPALNEDGTVTMGGRFGGRENSAPLNYRYFLTPTAEGVRVRLELEKTGELKLTSPGAWLHIFAGKDRFSPEQRLYARPAWHGRMAASAAGQAQAFLVEVADGRSVELDFGRFAAVNTEGTNANSYVYRARIIPREFSVGETAVAEYTIRFSDMPNEFPGEVKPMAEALAINSVTPSAESAPVYEKLELAVSLSATYDNPFDPDDVALDAVFTAPSGREITVPGFVMVDQERTVQDGVEVLVPRGNGAWKVRFAAAEAGLYTWKLKLRDRSGEISGGEGSFTATAPEAPGFVRVSKADPHYMAFDSGKGYFAIGHNLPIYHPSDQLADEAMRKFAAAKENYNRWWMCSYGFGIEWEDRLGWYRQSSAAQIDYSLDWARELGLYYMMCMDTHQDFREGGWEKNPFNAKNGGPCEKAGDWFTDETARDYYRKRLRYTVARWGYSPNVLCWEFGNEMEGWADSPDSIKLPWHAEMSDYLASIDPFDHLITTSFWSHTGPPDYWRLPNIDLVQTHCYTNNDENVGPQIRRFSLHQWNTHPKPHIFGEFGIRSHSTTADRDPAGWGVHNSLWSGMASLCAGPPMPWWHENYIDPLDLYFHFTSLANFVEGLGFGETPWQPLETTVAEYLDPNRAPELGDALIQPISRWAKPEHDTFVLLPDGTIEQERTPQELLHGSGHADLKNPPSFVATFPQPGKFTLRVGTVSNSGLLRIWLDGEQVAEIDLPCGEGIGKSAAWRPQWNLWESTYDQDFSIDVPAGEHRIRVENFGKDWVRVKGYVFGGCKVTGKPDVLVCGMKSGDGKALLWLQNRRSSWFNHAGNGDVTPVDGFRFTASGLTDGSYRMEWWETWKGSMVRSETVQVVGGRLTVELPELQTDVAVKLLPM